MLSNDSGKKGGTILNKIDSNLFYICTIVDTTVKVLYVISQLMLSNLSRFAKSQNHSFYIVYLIPPIVINQLIHLLLSPG